MKIRQHPVGFDCGTADERTIADRPKVWPAAFSITYQITVNQWVRIHGACPAADANAIDMTFLQSTFCPNFFSDQYQIGRVSVFSRK
jgi:hypothetical protein